MKTLKPQFIRLNSTERLYELDWPIIGITGGIGTGKSTVSKLFRDQGLNVLDADGMVKKIYQSHEGIEFVRENFKDAWVNDEIHFPKLRQLFFENKDNQTKIEKFIYDRMPDAFRKEAAKVTKQSFYIYDVPLLFERKLADKIDLIVLVYAPEVLQLERIIQRDKITRAEASKILQQQEHIESKRTKSHLVLENVGDLAELKFKTEALLKTILI